MSVVALTYCVAFLISYVQGGLPTVDLLDLTLATKAVFFDFDKTLTIAPSYGKIFRNICLGPDYDHYPDYTNYPSLNACDQLGDMVEAFDSIDNQTQNVIDAFGGLERIDRLMLSFERLMSADSTVDNIYCVSTSWEPIIAEEWGDFIFEVFQVIGLDERFDRDHILPLYDAGVGETADKGARIAEQLEALGLDQGPSQCIFAEDSIGNIENNVGICDTVFIQERDGVDETDLNYIVARATLFPKEYVDYPDATDWTTTDAPDATTTDASDATTTVAEPGDANIHVPSYFFLFFVFYLMALF